MIKQQESEKECCINQCIGQLITCQMSKGYLPN